MQVNTQIMTATICLILAQAVGAAVTPEEANTLGTHLTPMGAERNGNRDNTIPAWQGGLKTPPACYKKEEGRLCDPFANEKPLFSIDAGNMQQYGDRLSEGQKALLKRYPGYRMDVYPSHRTAALPQWLYENTANNAVRAHTTGGGIGLQNASAGTPFPIPKDGYEAMWNHLTRYLGQARTSISDTYNVDAAGNATLAVRTKSLEDFPYYDRKKTDAEVLWRLRHNYVAPARQAGWGIILIDYVNAASKGRRAWQYLPGQRRVKLAPDLAFDTPATQNAGAAFYDDIFMFNGSMERFDFKLIGKKEIFIPYNTYKWGWTATVKDILKPQFVNPDVMRWELHRVWVVEATLKSDARHGYSKRRFYLDEDTWIAVLNENYDARGELWRTAAMSVTPNYDVLVPGGNTHVYYDLNSGAYSHISMVNEHKIDYLGPQPDTAFAPDALAGAGIR
ncbi:MAG: DUF1329 domain-containing protein [Zoogloeaceae bacterium]|jgi:hypothetical protein|nr:DUF1329 domain-containing protein [Zoogloeaceae bacterium]